MGHAWISSCGLWDKRLFDPGINIDVIRIAISDGFEGKLLQFEWNCEGSTNPSCKYYSKLKFCELNDFGFDSISRYLRLKRKIGLSIVYLKERREMKNEALFLSPLRERKFRAWWWLGQVLWIARWKRALI